MKAAYRRLVIKLSGERLAGESGFGISPTVIAEIAQEVYDVHQLGTQIGVVIGGGNVIRGITAAGEGMDRAAADPGPPSRTAGRRNSGSWKRPPSRAS